jgi:hypothetical protein
MSSKAKKIIEEDKSDPIRWAQPKLAKPFTEYKPTAHYREADLKHFRDIPSLVTGGRV